MAEQGKSQWVMDIQFESDPLEPEQRGDISLPVAWTADTLKICFKSAQEKRVNSIWVNLFLPLPPLSFFVFLSLSLSLSHSHCI